MSVLTKRELRLMNGELEGTSSEKLEVISKVEEFQFTLSNRSYVTAINRLIPGAEDAAKKAAKAGEDFNTVFHREMNARARAQGLRQ